MWFLSIYRQANQNELKSLFGRQCSGTWVDDFYDAILGCFPNVWPLPWCCGMLSRIPFLHSRFQIVITEISPQITFVWRSCPYFIHTFSCLFSLEQIFSFYLFASQISTYFISAFSFFWSFFSFYNGDMSVHHRPRWVPFQLSAVLSRIISASSRSCQSDQHLAFIHVILCIVYFPLCIFIREIVNRKLFGSQLF